MKRLSFKIVQYSRLVFLFASAYFSEYVIYNGFNKLSLILYIMILLITILLLVSGWIKKTIGLPNGKTIKSIVDGKGNSFYSIILTFTVLIYMEWVYNSLYPVDVVTLQSNLISSIPIIAALVLSFCLLPRIVPKDRHIMFSGISFKNNIDDSIDLLLKPLKDDKFKTDFKIDKLVIVPSTKICDCEKVLESCKNFVDNVIMLPGVDYDDFDQCIDSFRNAIIQNEDQTHDTILYITPGTSIVSASLSTFAMTKNRKCLYLKQDGTNVLSMFSLKLKDMEPDTMQ